MNAQTFKTPAGEEMVVLPRAEYDALIARLEELEEDAADADAARVAKSGDDGQGYRAVAPDEVRGHYLRFGRKAAGLTQVELSERTGLSQGYLSDLESGRRQPSPEALTKLASALGITGEDLARLREGYGLSPSGYSRICEPLPSRGA